jgi:hypothetical protein
MPEGFDPFESRPFMSDDVREAFYPPHPYSLAVGPGFSPEELKLIKARFTLLDVFGQLMLNKYWEEVDEYDYEALARIIFNAYCETKKNPENPA